MKEAQDEEESKAEQKKVEETEEEDEEDEETKPEEAAEEVSQSLLHSQVGFFEIRFNNSFSFFRLTTNCKVLQELPFFWDWGSYMKFPNDWFIDMSIRSS